jgi:L-asparaginase/Glu-tRNA(Gln) amidotransferase subunit D
MLHALREATAKVPVLLTCRVQRPAMLFATYGFEGAEPDLRASGAICVPFLSPAAARVSLLCCLGSGLDAAGMATALASWDCR